MSLYAPVPKEAHMPGTCQRCVRRERGCGTCHSRVYLDRFTAWKEATGAYRPDPDGRPFYWVALPAAWRRAELARIAELAAAQGVTP